MGRYLLIRIATAFPQLILISLLSFAVMKMAPGDPVASLVGGREYMTAADYERVSRNLGLDRPVPVQYIIWLGNLARGNWGKSLRDGREIQGIVSGGLKASLVLVGTASIFLIPLSLAAGYWAGTRPRSWVDHAVSGSALLSAATPAFWLGLVLIVLFAVKAGFFPSSGQRTLGEEGGLIDRAAHLVLPVLTIVLTQAGPYIRLARGSIQDTMSADFLRAARARGLKRRTRILRYLLPNALTPFITWVGLSFPLLVGGVFIVEWVFAWPGLGRLFLQAAVSRDYPMLMASVLVTGVLVIAGNILADLLVAWLNPKLRRGDER
ncbi:MAG: ABC transporter permease [Candidatus Manganitrophus sp.]|nr:ABC transporter permease [Candidatus Manganitrophus sp.]WDT72248.1 MAG: ABC transporter permease [Candidatus Manganitrophus sp.]WDT75507.1 MAG: ABC transporter permease [Candidatus Manganitrophus sp.]WDT80320.1 MAG: ABC transporter permease [Candidatus Manganitrophus sp.]